MAGSDGRFLRTMGECTVAWVSEDFGEHGYKLAFDLALAKSLDSQDEVVDKATKVQCRGLGWPLERHPAMIEALATSFVPSSVKRLQGQESPYASWNLMADSRTKNSQGACTSS